MRTAIRVFSFLTVAILSSVANSSVRAAEMAVADIEGGKRITIDGKPFAEYLTLSGAKPIVWPIIGPDGSEMTRNFPMKKVEGELHDHPHHRSLWFTHGSVNGIDFWTESPKRGKQIHKEFLKCEAADGAVVISTLNDWETADGKKVLEDTRTLTFRGDDKVRTIDFDITLKATAGPVVFGDTKEGTMGLRVPSSIDVAQKNKDNPLGEIVSSEAQRNGDAWGKQAAWVDYHGMVDGRTEGVAIMNHPSSFRFPTYWHVRDYGLFAANPFGIHDFRNSKDSREGAFTLAEGETMTLRYRFVFHPGNERDADIAALYEAYANEARP